MPMVKTPSIKPVDILKDPINGLYEQRSVYLVSQKDMDAAKGLFSEAIAELLHIAPCSS